MPETPSSLLGQIQANTTGGVVNRYPPKLGFIGDVDGTPATNGQFLEYDTTRGLWVPHTLTAADLDDFNLAGLTTDDMLIWNGTDFVRTPPAAAVSVGTANSAGTADTWSRSDHVHANANLDSLTDVVITAAATGELLRYNGTNWVDDRAALDDLSDVVITAAASGEVIRHNGTNWVDGRVALDDLSDAVITSVQQNNGFYYDGSNWVNDNASWTTYTPGWLGSGSNPAIGNGTLSGRYLRRGKRTDVWIEVVCGSTTTFGSGDYTWNMPADGTTTRYNIGSFIFYDSSAGVFWTGVAELDPAAESFTTQFGVGTNARLGATNPVTWANGDIARLQITVELD